VVVEFLSSYSFETKPTYNYDELFRNVKEDGDRHGDVVFDVRVPAEEIL